jgi:hypothetical protein
MADLEKLKANALEVTNMKTRCIGVWHGCPHCYYEVESTEVLEMIGEIERLREFASLVRQYDPRTDIYANELHGEACKALGLCPCCGEKECEEGDD